MNLQSTIDHIATTAGLNMAAGFTQLQATGLTLAQIEMAGATLLA